MKQFTSNTTKCTINLVKTLIILLKVVIYESIA